MPTAPTAKTQKRKAQQEPMFPDRIFFKVFLEHVEDAARGAEVKPKNIRLILESLKEKFGQGLSEEPQW